MWYFGCYGFTYVIVRVCSSVLTAFELGGTFAPDVNLIYVNVRARSQCSS